MSIENTKLIDFAGRDRQTGDVCLSISDHLPWDDEHQGIHLRLLQDKIYAYLDFIESGEIYEKYPMAKGSPIVINIIGKYPLAERAKIFLDKITAYVHGLGLTLQFKILKSD